MSTLTSVNSRVLLAATLLLIVLLFTVASGAGAASWSVKSQGTCPSGSEPIGDSWLNWEGQSVFSVGKSWDYLWYWNGGWILKSQGYGEANGSANTANAHTSASRIAGSWIETGNHQATFFSGTVSSEGSIFTC